MMKADEHTAPIRIVKKKKGGHGGHHGGAWKVAYADFVTAMMALFIVLWILSQGEEVKKAVEAYFKDPGAFETSKGSSGVLDGQPMLIDTQNMEEQLRKREQQKLEAMADQIMTKLGEQPAMKNMLDHVKMELVKEGLRIELLENSESFFFDIGTARLKPEAVKVLETIALEVAQLPNFLIVEGHTDGRPYNKGAEYTNFELSADRANSARRVLVHRGVAEGKITEIRGWADHKLRNAADPFDLVNRRISIIIKFEGT